MIFNNDSASGSAHAFGDLSNCNATGTPDINDVAPFSQALIDPAGYAGSFHLCDINLALSRYTHVLIDERARQDSNLRHSD